MNRDLRDDITHGRVQQIGGHFGDPLAMSEEKRDRYNTALGAAQMAADARLHHNRAVEEATNSPTVSVREGLSKLLAKSHRLSAGINAALVKLGLEPAEAPIALEGGDA